MAFSKSFPRTVKGSNYPIWEETFLTDLEEHEEEQKCRKENLRLMEECVEDAKKIIDSKKLNKYQTDMVNIAIALYDKRASHSIYWKENKAKEKFDLKFNK
jgi:hypothetical protein